ncbi:MAG: hypothetical protein U5Q44_02945 [Dehalococcoidia bacterium]|nr:hypothetical protein [Dehalococcoidia bacterium]
MLLINRMANAKNAANSSAIAVSSRNRLVRVSVATPTAVTSAATTAPILIAVDPPPPTKATDAPASDE